MGRYDGEYYPEKPPCWPDEHNFAMNGDCWKCGHSRQDLIERAKEEIQQLGIIDMTLEIHGKKYRLKEEA